MSDMNEHGGMPKGGIDRFPYSDWREDLEDNEEIIEQLNDRITELQQELDKYKLVIMGKVNNTGGNIDNVKIFFDGIYFVNDKLFKNLHKQKQPISFYIKESTKG